jgi:hypothetical protein
MRAKGGHIESWWDIAHYRGEMRRSRNLRSLQVAVAVLLAATLLGYAVAHGIGLI